ncbi:MAG TPA: hypothetical protein DCL77_16000 [Prolixibacteraceae bacterium]|jgi:PAS domain S-box-containing protein|nr:hypothetical protein [Prolixibacteraceae bacterium]
MEKKDSGQDDSLKKKAVENLEKEQSERWGNLTAPNGFCPSPADHLNIIHQLEISHIELEIQNEELKQALHRATTATALYDYSPSGYFTLENNGTILEMNHNGAKMIGKERSELLGKNFIQFVSSDSLILFLDFLKKAVETDSKQNCEIRLVFNEACFIDVHLEGFVYNRGKTCLVTAIDITASKRIKETIRLSESRLKRAELVSKTGNWEFHVDTQDIFASEGAIKIYGVEGNTLKYADIKNVTLQHYRHLLNHTLKNLIEENLPYDVEFKIKAQDTGEIKDIHSLATFDRDKRILFGSIQDITERKQLEDRLHESEQYYRTMVETSPDAIVILDTLGQLQFASQRAFEIFFLPSDNPLGSSIFQWIAPEMKELTLQRFSAILSGKINPELYEYKIIRNDNSVVWTEIRGSRLQDAEGEDKGIFLICRDVTERKHADDALQQAHEELKNLHDTLDEAIFSFDPVNQKMLIVSKAHETIFGCPVSEFFKNPDLWYELVIPEDKYIIDDGFSVLYQGNNLQHEYRIIRPDGQLRWISSRMQPTLDKEGKLIQVNGIANDITEQKRAEEENRESAEKFRMVFENVFDGIVIYDEDNDPFKRKLIDCNEQYAHMAGRSRQELLEMGHTYALQISLDDSSNSNRINSLARKKAFQGTYSWIRPDGKDNVIEYIGVPIIWGGKSFSIGIDRDITVHRRAEEEVKKSLSLLTATLNSTTDGILVVDKKGKITHFNEKFVELWQIPQSMHSTWNENIERSTILNQLKDPESFLNKVKEMYIHEEESSFDTLEFKDGRTIERYSQPQISEGKSVGRVWNFRDITQHRRAQAELIAAKEKAEESDRLKSAFLANMSHEIRTPLNSIIGFSELMSDPDFDKDQEYQFAQIINASGNNLLTIISDIMDISKIEAGQLEVKKRLFSVSQLISDLQIEYSFKALERGIELIIDPHNPCEVFIESDQTKLRQILVNLVGNSIKFTEKGSIEIGLKIEGELLEFHVKDTGIGISAEFQTKIFERFRQIESPYTRKYGGTGLGLAISKSLTELLGGKLWMESEQGVGSTFYFHIPIR